jgi:uncharacterized glyoxalase superfamily protein PhnB
MTESSAVPQFAESGADDRAVESCVEVPVDSETAFRIFTEELDMWWVRGPINFFDAGRAVEMRCEPGVGGRLLEVYDDSAGDALELGVLTEWEPGKRLAWRSSVDDVRTEVVFEGVPGGTSVRVVARVPAGGVDMGGTAWVRVVPKWFGPWCRHREGSPKGIRDIARIGLGVYYAKPAAAARWLAETFGFTSPDPIPEGEDPLPDGHHGHPWIEFRIGNSSLMVFPKRNDEGATTTEAHGAAGDSHRAVSHVPWVYVDDVGAHFRHAAAAGARILEDLDESSWLPRYVAEDPEGNRWTFAQARPTMV